MSVTRSNLITLQLLDAEGSPIGERISLTLVSPWKWSTGLTPNINHARIPWTVYELISGALNAPCLIEFWYSHAPGEAPQTQGDNQPAGEFGPDLSIEPVFISGVQPGEIKELLDGRMAPEDYELYLADFRQRWVDPRGPRLTLGLLNPGPIPDDQNDYSFSDLLQACLDAMGLDTPIPDGLDDIAAPRDVKWFGNHAPTELGKLLQQCGCVFVPYLTDDAGFLDKIRGDGEPDIPAGIGDPDRLPDILLPDLDIRSKVVIYTSYPTPVLITETRGYGQEVDPGDFGSEDPNQWEYVAQDSDGSWKSIESNDFQLLHAAGGFLKACQSRFEGIPAESRAPLEAQMFRFVRLKESYAPAAASQVQRMITDADADNVISLSEVVITCDDMAVIHLDGHFYNLGAAMDVSSKEVLDGNIVALAAPCFTTKSPNNRISVEYVRAPANFTIRYTRSGVQDDGQGNQVPWYYQAGFSIGDDGSVEQLDDAEVQAIIAGESKADARIFSRPQYALLQIDDEIINQDDLDGQAQAEAERYFAGIQFPAKVARIRGYCYVGLSGLVSEVEYDQAEVLTTARINDWFTADGALRLGDLQENLATPKKGKGGAAEAFPNQSTTESSRAQMGAIGSPLGVGTRALNPTQLGGQGKPGAWIQLGDHDDDGFFAWSQVQPSDGSQSMVEVDGGLSGSSSDSPAVFSIDLSAVDPDDAATIWDAMVGRVVFAVPESMLATDAGPDDPPATPAWVVMWPNGSTGKQTRYDQVIWDNVNTLKQNVLWVYYLGGCLVKEIPQDPITIFITREDCVTP